MKHCHSASVTVSAVRTAAGTKLLLLSLLTYYRLRHTVGDRFSRRGEIITKEHISDTRTMRWEICYDTCSMAYTDEKHNILEPGDLGKTKIDSIRTHFIGSTGALLICYITHWFSHLIRHLRTVKEWSILFSDLVILLNPFTADPVKVTLCHTGLTHHF